NPFLSRPRFVSLFCPDFDEDHPAPHLTLPFQRGNMAWTDSLPVRSCVPMEAEKMKRQVYLAPLLFAALLAACTPAKTVKKGPQDTAAAGADGAAGDAAGGSAQNAKGAPPTEVAEASVRGSEFSAAAGLETAHFDYDSYALSNDARGVLKKNADYLK